MPAHFAGPERPWWGSPAAGQRRLWLQKHDTASKAVDRSQVDTPHRRCDEAKLQLTR